MKLIPIVLTASVLAVGGALFFTNPSEEDYVQYAAQSLTEDVQRSLCEAEGIPPLLERLDDAIGSFCERTVGRLISSDVVSDVLLENTERKNRVFFSTYETTFPSQTYKAIGLFDRFYTYGSSWTTSAELETAQ